VPPRIEVSGALGVRRDQHARDRPGDQDEPPGSPGRPQRERGDEVTDADHHERQRHHPPVGRALRGQRADRVGHRIESRLQAGGRRPSADHQDRSRGR
jgi:hypothetical protein